MICLGFPALLHYMPVLHDKGDALLEIMMACIFVGHAPEGVASVVLALGNDAWDVQAAAAVWDGGQRHVQDTGGLKHLHDERGNGIEAEGNL